jgi:Polyketide cyclase / dehydrase and lipid transport
MGIRYRGIRMQWILILLVVLVALVATLLIAGMLLPRNHRATSRIEIRTAPGEVWAVIRDLGQVPAFWPDIKSSERQPDRDGKEAWSQTMKNGFALPLIVEEELPPSRLVTRIAIEGKAPFGGSWIYRVEPAEGGSRVSLTEDGWVDNPFFRVISRIMGHHSTLDSYLRALGARFGQKVEPQHVPE